MKKRNLRLTKKQHGLSRRRLGLEDLERRLLLAFDIILGPGTNEPLNEVFAEVRLDEIEQEEDSPSARITNNSIADAELVPLGFDEGEFAAIDLRGELIRPVSVGQGFSSERNPPNNPPSEDSSILLANLVNPVSGIPIALEGTLGDSPAGFNETMPDQRGGDADFYELREVEVGEVITGQLSASTSAVLILYDEFGQVVVTTDTNSGAFIAHQVQEEGDFFFAVVPYGNDPAIFDTPLNPFDASTALGGPGGTYTLTIGVDAIDMDYYALELNAGDILGVNAVGSANLLTLFGPDGEMLIQSGQDLGGPNFPASSPMPRGDTASLGYVIDTSGTYFLAANGVNWSRYVLEMRLFRPSIETADEGAVQVLFLDFDGAILNPELLGGTANVRELSPMARFMGRWGLRDESALIDRIVAVVEENFDDLKAINPNANVEILNSRDHPDPFGQPHVSRIIIGGTSGEATITTVGIAESVDVGNFDMEETAIVLLDILSGPRSDPTSLNHFPIATGASKVDLVAAGVGNIATHEFGHLLGMFHTDLFNRVTSIMDQGGDLAETSGVGPDLIWGTRDDIDVDFATDEFAFAEGFVGFQNTPAALAHLLVTGQGVDPDDPDEVGFSLGGTVFRDANGNGFRDAGDGGLAGARVYVDLDNDLRFDIDEPATLSGATGAYQITGIPRVDSSLRVLVEPAQELTFPDEGGYLIDPLDPPVEPLDFGLHTRFGDNAGIDFGDAPESYGVASHDILTGFRLGSSIDGEPGPIANDSEDDGVSLPSLVIGQFTTGTAAVVTSGQSPGVLQGWIDFNRDGAFSASERVVRDRLVGEGSTSFSFNVPLDAQPGASYARFRYGYERGIGPAGGAIAGEVEDYLVQIARPGDDGGIPAAVEAVNDVRTMAQGGSIDIAVLANDTGEGISIFDVGVPSQGGAATVSQDQETIRYTPLASFFGTETFTYTITDGVTSDTALVSVNVQENGNGNGGGGEEKLIRFRLQTVDGGGQPITEITTGQDFALQVLTQDLRADAVGVFSAYLDVTFDPDLASIAGEVTFGQAYPAGQVADVSTPGLLNEVGAFAGLASDLGSDELLLASIPMTATGSEDIEFASDPADVLPAHEVLLGDILQAIPASSVEYTSTTLAVNPVVAAAFTNPRNPLDVNNDGAVSPADALGVINELNLNGARALPSGAAPVGDIFIDVNGDMHLSSLDALLVINYLNNQSPFAQVAESETANPEPRDLGPPATAAVAAAIDLALEEADDGEKMEDILAEIGPDLV